MTARKLTDNEIRIRIVPTHLRWPDAGTSAVWMKAHDCVNALQDLIRSVDVACIEAQKDRELSAGGIARRAEICNQALRKLVNFRAFEIAEKALMENIDALERLSNRDPQQVKMQKTFTQALHDLREGIEAEHMAAACSAAAGRMRGGRPLQTTGRIAQPHSGHPRGQSQVLRNQ